MPQMNPGGKFVFGASVIRPDGRVQFPPQAVAELPHCFRGQNLSVYRQPEHRWFLRHAAGIVPAVKTGAHSDQNPGTFTLRAPAGAFLRYKSRAYCWAAISGTGEIRLAASTMVFLHLEPGMQLLSIRSSDIAFTMGAKGPLLDRAAQFAGEIPLY